MRYLLPPHDGAPEPLPAASGERLDEVDDRHAQLVDPIEREVGLGLAGRRGRGAQTYRTEIAWREFYADVLWHRPDTARAACSTVHQPGRLQ